MSKDKYLVKFVRFNLNTIKSLINKTLKFSTVFDFNDFNELHYIGSGDKDNEEKLWNAIQNLIDNGHNASDIVSKLRANARTEDFLEKLYLYLNKEFFLNPNQIKNEKSYERKINIEKISPSWTEYKFCIQKENGPVTVNEWLSEISK